MVQVLLFLSLQIFSTDQAYCQTTGEPNQVYSFVDQVAEFPGGQDAMFRYLIKQIHYPTEARIKKIEGTVVLTFIVTETGKIRDIQVARGIEKSCDEEAIRVVRTMPDWTPAVLNGKKVAMQYTLPIKYKLS
jgi:protein TonB